MSQIYKVFFNESLLQLAPPGASVGDGGVEHLKYLDRSHLRKLIVGFESSGLKDFTISYPDTQALFRLFTSFFVVLEAAGGLVRHESCRYLFIKRFGKWDIPKGKIETGESPEAAAIREVMEESGITEPRVIKPLPQTYHTYNLEGTRILKKTWWYLMHLDGTMVTSPQREEGITEAVWLVPSQFDIVLENTYRSLAVLLGDIPWLPEETNLVSE
jgi:8-oxo-dGTP pyrophosphatase MutT (NUDIX family)